MCLAMEDTHLKTITPVSIKLFWNRRIASWTKATAQQSLKSCRTNIECRRLLNGNKRTIQFGTLPADQYMAQESVSVVR